MIAILAFSLGSRSSGGNLARVSPRPRTERAGSPWYSDGVNIRALATSNSAREGGLPGGASTTVYCYTVGQYQSNPPYSDDYWDYVDYNGVSGFTSDAFLNTGGTITSQVYPCVSGLSGGS